MLTLEIFDDGGVFRHSDGYEQIVEELDDALEQRAGGTLAPARYVKTLKALVDRHPHFIDGHAHLGYALMEEGKPKLALQACFQGLEVGSVRSPPATPVRSNGASWKTAPFCARHMASSCRISGLANARTLYD